ncbi:unnamed protein product [Closterium sp. Naga37s-1]|nr:unnamed protein product [Closterium sp. Naga37s-1]
MAVRTPIPTPLLHPPLLPHIPPIPLPSTLHLFEAHACCEPILSSSPPCFPAHFPACFPPLSPHPPSIHSSLDTSACCDDPPPINGLLLQCGIIHIIPASPLCILYSSLSPIPFSIPQPLVFLFTPYPFHALHSSPLPPPTTFICR